MGRDFISALMGNKETMKSIIAICFIFIALAQNGDSLKCHQCASINNQNCADPFHMKQNGTKYEKNEFLKECSPDENMCKKLYQKVSGKSDPDINRLCAKVDKNDTEMYETGTDDYGRAFKVYYCKEDGCNGSQTLAISLGLFFLASVFGMTFN